MRNILGDDALSASSRNQSLLLSATFWIPAVLLAVAVGASAMKKLPMSTWVRSGLMGLATWSVLVWVFRAVDIALTSDRGVAFIVVHVVLGVISITLAALVVGELRSPVERRTSSLR